MTYWHLSVMVRRDGDMIQLDRSGETERALVDELAALLARFERDARREEARAALPPPRKRRLRSE